MKAGRPLLSPRLLRAYRRTLYCTPGILVRIGRRSTAMDAALMQHQARCAVFVTAWNPYSSRMPEGWNRRMQACLRQRLRRRPTLPASGALGRWREDHLLVLAPLPWVARIARTFRQSAVVAIRPGAPARLHLLDGAGSMRPDLGHCSSCGSAIIRSAR